MGVCPCRSIPSALSASSNEESSSEPVRLITSGRNYTVEVWKGAPSGTNRAIIHPKDLDFSCDMIPIADILPQNDKLLFTPPSNNLLLTRSYPTKRIWNQDLWRNTTRRSQLLRISSPASVQGITLQALKDILKRNPGSEGYETKGLVDNVFNKCTRDERCTMLSKLKGEKDSNGCWAVGKMDYFVSYSWSYKIDQLIEALREFEISLGRKAGRPVYFFIDCVCINQWHPAKHLDDLDRTICSADGLVMVILDWENPIPLQRAWCLFEISIALSSATRVHVGMTNSTRKALRKALFSNFDHVLQKMDKIDVRHAGATYEKDLYDIRDKIKSMIGYGKLNNRVINALKDWLVDEAERMLKAISTIRDDGAATTDQRVLLDKLEILAKLKRHMGDYKAAESMFQEVYNEKRRLFGPEHIGTIVAQCNYGNHLRELRKFENAAELLTECFRLASETLGENHTITLIAQACLGLLAKNVGDWEKAEKILTEVLRKGTECKGTWARDWDNLTRASNLALVLQLQGKVKEAYVHLENCYFESKKMLGERHEFVMIDMHNLGAALCRVGNHKAAEKILNKCYEGRIELLRNGHVRAVMTLWWWAISSIKLGKLEKAQVQLSEVMHYLKKLYGSSNHERVQACRELYDAVTTDELKMNSYLSEDFSEIISFKI